jgi:AcrR family transcriptional regulator
MPRPLIDLLWRDHPSAPRGGSRGPRPRVGAGDVVAAALRLADTGGLAAVTVRALAADLGIPTMSVYTHVNGRDDLLVLMADVVHGSAPVPAFGRAGWRTRVRRLADANLQLYRAHPWLGEVTDERTAFGPGTIAKYDHELHAFDELPLDDVARDAALTFVLDFVRALASAQAATSGPDMGEEWEAWSGRLASYVGEDHPLARRVGAAAGEAMQAPRSAQHAWEFGLDRVLDGLATLSPTAGLPDSRAESRPLGSARQERW